MSDADDAVQCATHGTTTATYVCQHLLAGEQRGFNFGYDPDAPDALYPDAWCDACETIRKAEGGWNDTSEAHAGIKLLCSACYEIRREKNWIEDREAFEGLRAASCQYLQGKQETFVKKFKINDHERWDWDQDSAKLVFSHEGMPQVEAEIDFCGSISTASNTWMWAWGNTSLAEGIKSSSRRVRAIGEKRGFHKLAAAHWRASEEDGWDMTAIMAETLGAIGAYRTPNDNGFMFMVVRQAQWLNKKGLRRWF